MKTLLVIYALFVAGSFALWNGYGHAHPPPGVAVASTTVDPVR